ncbi:uncharacterized protein EAF02_009043 [Botrytis sinoallii]|uniref:uncharacterized protein n=1 Tax=Botrytis sinoallii TaxID=1463999 RepID=UPI0019012B87|nr:uncharacterized protein EAF02_009043 [Botrytis sinoallii]KAF7871938.1 hypothetical protein EAF02_009043 [Botrytis sinoallii]
MGVLKHAVDFASDAAGLEKTLRLIQALCQICAFYPTVLGWILLGLGIGMGRRSGGVEGGVDAKMQVQIVEKLWKARRELAVGRRYMRFFRFIKNFSKAWDSLLNEDGMRMLINVGKSGFMGAYLDILWVYAIPLGPLHVLLKAINFVYRYLEGYGIFTIWLSTTDTTPKSNSQENIHDPDLATKTVDSTQIIAEHPGKNEKKGKFKTEILLKIIENAADLFQPGAGTGWIVSDRGIVGVMTVISTVLSSRDIWRRVGHQKERRIGGNGEELERR